MTVFISHSCQVSGTRGLSQDDFALSITADRLTGATFPTELPLTLESHQSFRITEHPSAQVTAPMSSRFSILHVSIAVVRLRVPVSRALEVTAGILRSEWGVERSGPSTGLPVSGHRIVKSSLQSGVYYGMKDAFVEARKPS